MSRMFKVEAWVLLYLFKFRIQIIKMSNVAGISKYWTTLNIFSIQNRRGNSNIQSFRIVGVIRQKLKTMALMVKIVIYTFTNINYIQHNLLYVCCLIFV